MKTTLVILGTAFILSSCGSNTQDAKNDQNGNAAATVKSGENTVNNSKLNADSLVKVIDAERAEVESKLTTLQKNSLSTRDLRAQIKQKWSKIDFYSDDTQIVRIKSYPYEKISQRTEEFYFQNGKLVLAFIEDEGLKFTGKSQKRVGKTYYFYENAVIKEDNPTNEKETSIRSSDSERLLQEATEYLELFPKK